jgi:hypothetical protein
MLTAEEQGIVKKKGPPGRRFIAVDLDGTLANYEKYMGKDHIGAPVPLMVERVKTWLDEGHVVCIFTARVADEDTDPEVYALIHAWCEEHLGERLYVTAVKHRYYTSIYDDAAIGVEKNTGKLIGLLEAPVGA